MSLDKAISSGKEHRKPYHGAKACDKTCRNHGSDDWAKEMFQINYRLEQSEMRWLEKKGSVVE